MAAAGVAVSPGTVAAAVRAESDGVLADLQVLSALRELQRELIGAGPLEPLLADPQTTDVLVSGPDQVWIEQAGELRRTKVRFADADAVRRLAQRLALAPGRRLDDASPYVDAALPGGVRLHAVLPPIATGCTCISLRVLRPTTHRLDALQAVGSVSPEAGKLLHAIVAARLAFLVVGGTGSGNTTLHLRHTYRVTAFTRLSLRPRVVGRATVRAAQQVLVCPDDAPGPKAKVRGSVALADDLLGQAELMGRCHRRVPPPRSGFAGFRLPGEVIMLAVRWYLPATGSPIVTWRSCWLSGHRGSSRHNLPLGAAVHAAVDRRGEALPARPGRSLVRR